MKYAKIGDTDAGRRHLEGVDPEVVERARLGLNEVCVDCGGVPLGAGLRCTDCYFRVAGKGRAKCGTDAGYQRHYRLGESACLSCADAHSEALKVRRRRAG